MVSKIICSFQMNLGLVMVVGFLFLLRLEDSEANMTGTDSCDCYNCAD